MNTARWTAWVTMVHASDSALVQITTMVAAALLVWENLSRVPEPWQGHARSAYLFGLAIVFLYFTGGAMDTNGLTIVLFVVTFVVGGILAVALGGRKPSQNSTVENQAEEKTK